MQCPDNCLHFLLVEPTWFQRQRASVNQRPAPKTSGQLTCFTCGNHNYISSWSLFAFFACPKWIPRQLGTCKIIASYNQRKKWIALNFITANTLVSTGPGVKWDGCRAPSADVHVGNRWWRLLLLLNPDRLSIPFLWSPGSAGCQAGD